VGPLSPSDRLSTPAKPTRKISARRERPGALTDARTIHRMVTGITTPPATDDSESGCSSGPESPTPCGALPRPQGLHITRRVGVDGVVIAWDPLEHEHLAGFQVLVGGRVVQHVRSPHRTKALVTGLPLAGSFTVALVAMGTDGRGSTPAVVTQDRSRLYRGPKRPEGGEKAEGGLRRSHSSPAANHPNHHRPLWNRSCVPSCL